MIRKEISLSENTVQSVAEEEVIDTTSPDFVKRFAGFTGPGVPTHTLEVSNDLLGDRLFSHIIVNGIHYDCVRVPAPKKIVQYSAFTISSAFQGEGSEREARYDEQERIDALKMLFVSSFPYADDLKEEVATGEDGTIQFDYIVPYEPVYDDWGMAAVKCHIINDYHVFGREE